MAIKKIVIGAIVFSFFWGIGFAVQELQEFKADPAHSSISFSIRHMMVSKIIGRFKDFDVTIMADTVNIINSTVTAVIKTASIDTENETRDNDLRSAHFFDVGKFPEITFKSTAVKKKEQNYELWGALTMHGITKEIVIPFEIMGHMTDPQGITRVGIEGKVNLDRRDYGIIYNQTLDQGGLAVGDEVAIDILLELVNKK